MRVYVDGKNAARAADYYGRGWWVDTTLADSLREAALARHRSERCW